MQITLLGSTGRTGRHLVTMLHDVHELTLPVRNREALPENLSHRHTVITGDILDGDVLHSAIHNDTALVISCLSTDKQQLLSKVSIPLINRIRSVGGPPLISIGTAGILDARGETGKYRFETSESKRRSTVAAEDHLAFYHALKDSSLNWTIICPTYLPDDDAIRPVVFAADVLPEGVSRIGTATLAAFIADHLDDSTFKHKRIGVAEEETHRM